MGRGMNAGLQSICANDFICRHVFDDQVVANVVEKIDIEPGDSTKPSFSSRLKTSNRNRWARRTSSVL